MSQVQLSKGLSFILRHGAADKGIAMRPDGYCNLSDIMSLPQFRKWSLDDVKHAVANNDKNRFTLLEESSAEGVTTLLIRANQGHSLPTVVDAELFTPISDPGEVPVCCHGTYLRFWADIKSEGLCRMARRHIHMMPGEPHEGQVISGMRSNCEILVYIDVKRAMKEGAINFFRSANNVILSPGLGEKGIIPPMFFEKVVNVKNGKILFKGSQLRLDDSACKIRPISAENLKYFAVLDFEATCVESGKLPCQEIIEFPIVLVDRTGSPIIDKSTGQAAEQSVFVRPTKSKITEFCTKLTSITQEDVDSADVLEDVLEKTHSFLQSHGCNDVNFLFVTCGDWDLKSMLPKQIKDDHLSCRGYLKRWLNVKVPFEAVHGRKDGMAGMLNTLNIPLEGHHHRGIDDCRNISKILKRLLADGCSVQEMVSFSTNLEAIRHVEKGKSKKGACTST